MKNIYFFSKLLLNESTIILPKGSASSPRFITETLKCFIFSRKAQLSATLVSTALWKEKKINDSGTFRYMNHRHTNEKRLLVLICTCSFYAWVNKKRLARKSLRKLFFTALILKQIWKISKPVLQDRSSLPRRTLGWSLKLLKVLFRFHFWFFSPEWSSLQMWYRKLIKMRPHNDINDEVDKLV